MLWLMNSLINQALLLQPATLTEHRSQGRCSFFVLNLTKGKNMFEIKYPNITVNIIGQNGNAFCILGICKRAMERAKLPQTEIDAFMTEAMSGDYDHLLATVMSWFEVE